MSAYSPYTRAEVLTAFFFLSDALTTEQRREEETEAIRAQARAADADQGGTLPSDKVQGLLQAHHNKVAAAPEGQRHDTLLRHARALGGYVGSGALGRAEVEDTLSAAARGCGLTDDEAAQVITWGLDAGAKVPLMLPIRAASARQPKRPWSRRQRLAGWYT